MSLLWAAGLTWGISWMMSYWLSRAKINWWIAHPNERSLHSQPTPASGGLAILSGLVFGWSIVYWQWPNVMGMPWVYGGALIVAGISLWDDWRALPPGLRLAAHLLAASAVVGSGLSPLTIALPGLTIPIASWFAVIITLLFVIWMINLYNFMDGMDGFAGGMAVFGFSGYALLGWIGGEPSFSMASLLVALASAGFLWFNFPPARIFMGDVGASTLGYLAAVFALWGTQLALFPLWAAGLLFSPFIVDATVTLIRRLLAGERIWQAHRTHYYQRVVRLGWSHRKTVLWAYIVMIAAEVSTLALASLSVAEQWLMVIGWCVTYFFVGWRIQRWEQCDF